MVAIPNTELLKWALSRAGMTVEDLQDKLPKLRSWLDGSSEPSMRQLEDFAKRTLTPLGILFLREPPSEILPVVDYRTTSNVSVRKPSAELMATLHDAQRRQDWMREYLQNEGAEPLQYVGSVVMTTPVQEAVVKMRRDLGIERDWTLNEKNWEAAYAKLRCCAEDAGVLVTVNSVVGLNNHRPLNVEEFRGFVLIDDLAPLVFVNGADAEAARMFTLAHELAHVWMGKAGILDLDIVGNTGIESKCNSIAAELLVDSEVFSGAWQEAPERYDDLARKFKVSSIVIARKALDSFLITPQQFRQFYLECLARWRHVKERQREEDEGGPNFFKAHAVRIGKRFSNAVISAALERKVTLTEAFRLTGLRGKTFFSFVKDLKG